MKIHDMYYKKQSPEVRSKLAPDRYKVYPIGPHHQIVLFSFVLLCYMSIPAKSCDFHGGLLANHAHQENRAQIEPLRPEVNERPFDGRLQDGFALFQPGGARLGRYKRARSNKLAQMPITPRPTPATSTTAKTTSKASVTAADDEQQSDDYVLDDTAIETSTKPRVEVISSTRRPKTTTSKPTSKPTNKPASPSKKVLPAKQTTTRPPKKVETTESESDQNEESGEDEDGEGEGEKMEQEEQTLESSSRGYVSKDKQKQPPSSSTNATLLEEAKQKKRKSKPLVRLPFLHTKNESLCAPEAYLEFPQDLIGNKWRSRGLVIIHIGVVCYMFYALALVCERYFMPSLEEFAQRLQLSEDVAGATLMSAGSSAPELFTAILGVFVAKGDVGTGAIVGSAVFNILFVIGICAFVSTTTAQLNWWPVLRDSVYYTFTVLVLILFIYDENITMLESSTMIALYGVYILIMVNNEKVKEHVTRVLQSHPLTNKLISSAISVDGPDDVFGSTSCYGSSSSNGQRSYQTREGQMKTVEDDSMFLAAMLVIMKHKRLFRSQLRFRSAARYIIVKRQHKLIDQRLKQSLKLTGKNSNEVNYFGPESEPLKSSNNQKERMAAYAQNAALSKNKFSIVSREDYEPWNRPPEEGENYYLWLAKIPVNYVLHYTIPDCTLYPDKYLLTFIISIVWTAFFSYIMVWMVTLIGYTFGIPDSVMGVTFLAAGTSVPDCYSSIHAARNGMADMAVSNSIGSNVFDILIGLSLPWFVQTIIGQQASINSRGIIYSVILLFLSLIVTIYLMNKNEWTLKPRLGLALLIAYGLFIMLTCMLEFNLFGHVNPLPC